MIKSGVLEMVLLFHASTELLEASLEAVLFDVFCNTACCSPGLGVGGNG